MGRRNEVYVVASLPLETYHDLGEIVYGDFIPLASMAYVMVLAVDTSEIAMRKEYGAAAAIARKRGLFAEVRLRG